MPETISQINIRESFKKKGIMAVDGPDGLDGLDGLDGQTKSDAMMREAKIHCRAFRQPAIFFAFCPSCR